MSITNDVLAQLGFHYGAVPTAGMEPRTVYVTIKDATGTIFTALKVWINWLPPMPEGRRWKRSTHRLRCNCPVCGRQLSVGRVHQHVGTSACYSRLARPVREALVNRKAGDNA